MTKDEALKLALEVLERASDAGYSIECEEAVTALRKALAQPEQLVLAQEVIGCFEAAEVEGLTAALANTTDEHLKDLVERRLMYALYAAQETREKQNECN
jgi:predicted negative regulator of RcsB-dependent stress response